MKRSFFARLKLLGFSLLILVITSCVGSNNLNSNNLSTPTTPSVSVFSTATENSSIPNEPKWIMTGNKSSTNQVRVMLFDGSNGLWAGGPGGLVHWDTEMDISRTYAINAKPDSTDVVALAQTADNAIWIGTFGDGITKFDGVNWEAFTTQNGFLGDYIISLVTTKNGELWFDTKTTGDFFNPTQKSYFGQYKNKQWNREVGGGFSWLLALPNGSIVGAKSDTGIAKHDSKIAIYDGNVWERLRLVGKTITAVTVAPNGVIWVATQDDILLYENETRKTISPPWAGRKDYPSVSSIAITSDGKAWFGFSYLAGDLDKCGSRADYIQEQGVYRFDGKTWTHFTEDDGLIDNKICTIKVDADDNVWIGSFDKGISRYDGSGWKTYAIP